MYKYDFSDSNERFCRLVAATGHCVKVHYPALFSFKKMLYHVLIAYLRICSRRRYSIKVGYSDESDVLDCLAFGFSKLVAEIEQGQELELSGDTIKLLHHLDARLSQVAYSSKHWYSSDEWASVEYYTWQIIDSLGLGDENDVSPIHPVEDGSPDSAL